MPGFAKTSTDLVGHLGLGPADKGYLAGQQGVGDGVGGSSGGTDGRYLLGVLHRPQRADDLAGRLEMGFRQGRLELEQVPGPASVRDAKAPPRSDEGGDDVACLLVLRPGSQLEKPRVMGDSRRLDLGDDQSCLVVDGQDEHRQTLERHRLVARQPGQVSAKR